MLLLPAGGAPQVTSPPFAAVPPLPQQPTASGALPDPASPSPTPSATPPPPSMFTAVSKPFGAGTPQHTPAPPPTTSMFSFAASPATVPVKGKHDGSSVGRHQVTGSPAPAMFSATVNWAAAGKSDDDAIPAAGTPAASSPPRMTEAQAPFPMAPLTALTPAAQQHQSVQTGNSQAPPPAAPAPSTWGSTFLQSNQSAAAKAAEAAAKAAEQGKPASTPSASGWGSAMLAQNQAAAAQAADAAAKAAEQKQPASTPAAMGWGSDLLAQNQAAAAKAAEAAVKAAEQKAPASTPAAGFGWGSDLITQNQAAAARAADAAAKAATQQKPASTPALMGWNTDLLAQNQAAAAQAAEAVAAAAKASEAAGNPPQAASSAAPVIMPIKSGVVTSAQTAMSGPQQGTQASTLAVPLITASGPFKFGVPLASAAAQTLSSPVTIPITKDTSAAQHGGEGSLVCPHPDLHLSEHACIRQRDVAIVLLVLVRLLAWPWHPLKLLPYSPHDKIVLCSAVLRLCFCPGHQLRANSYGCHCAKSAVQETTPEIQLRRKPPHALAA